MKVGFSLLPIGDGIFQLRREHVERDSALRREGFHFDELPFCFDQYLLLAGAEPSGRCPLLWRGNSRLRVEPELAKNFFPPRQ